MICCWRKATRFPTVIVSTASTAKIGRHVSATAGNAPNIRTRRPTKPPIFDAVERNAATGEGEPSYVSGAQKWNGTAEILNAKPTTTKNTLITINGSSPVAGDRLADPAPGSSSR